MRKKYLLIILVYSFLMTQCKPDKTVSYEQDKDEVDSLIKNESYKDAVVMLENMRLQHTEFEYDINKELALLYGKVNRYEESFKLWKDGHKKGYFHGLFDQFPIYKPFKNFEQFDSLCKVDMQIRAEAIENSKTIYEIITPQDYNSQENYPLLIVLHGGGSSIDMERKYWVSDRLNKEFIVVSIQSYLYYDMNTFGWLINDERAWNDLLICFNEVKNNYSIDNEKVIIGGISAGGYMAMEISINNIFRTNGFIAMCPDVTPEDFEIESIIKAKLLGVRGMIVTGENDYLLESQKKVTQIFSEINFPYQFKIIKGMGHEFPTDFSVELDSAISYFLDRPL